MIHVDQAIVVEGKYDKIKLKHLVDGLVIQTDGFRIFKDREKSALIRKLAQTQGVVVLTDSDTAGLVIRNYIQSIAHGGRVTNVFIPEILGKEKRKEKPSKAGFLGVEGISDEILRKRLQQAGIGCEQPIQRTPVTKYHLYEDGLSGGGNSKNRRKWLFKQLGLPEYLSTNHLLEYLNHAVGYEEYQRLIQLLKQEENQ
ncbi:MULTISPECIES: toprim domain-containing protein [Clostridiaceae]|uniref:DUF4093 domain-containing protein n=1 Tax=Clostridium facile TaxID=2763035 RepID=A0ABR7ISC2_9CLOT|nr:MULTISPECIES: DUF4093 domain-containing protein [Clostridiaceae]MBC5788033.1 DUF4093 domain-containing protein [Clostridium facile]PWM98264.1 MAG: DUF4093 domain-containing protein [Massilioclostridium sp.]PWM99434.1 MAG: DUF4093 domain-containing protein [Massilioclostridium sp.]